MFLLKLLKYLLLLFLLLFILFQIKFMPSYQSHLTYKSQTISITRDHAHNIPSIKGTSKLATFYGLGYATAQDRLFQLHMKRMVGKGRLSEMVGEKGINLDIFFRELGVGRISRQSVERMRVEDPVGFEAYQAYADGVNDYVKKEGMGMEFYVLWTEFQKWEVEDTFVIFKLTDWVQSADGGLTVARELLAQEMGREEAAKILGWREEHFIMVEESTMMTDDELRESEQIVRQKQEQTVLQQETNEIEQETNNNNQNTEQIIEEQIHQTNQENVEHCASQNRQQNKQQQTQEKQDELDIGWATNEVISGQQQSEPILKNTEEQTTPETDTSNQQNQNEGEEEEQKETNTQEQNKNNQEQIEIINIESNKQEEENNQQQRQTQVNAENEEEQAQSEPKKSPEEQNKKTEQSTGQIKEKISQQDIINPHPDISNDNQREQQKAQIQQKVQKSQQQTKVETHQETQPKQDQNQIQTLPNNQDIDKNNILNAGSATEQSKQTQQQPLPNPSQISTSEQQIPSSSEIKSQQIDSEVLNLVGGGASNSWVISGRHTKSGRPILANDPHLATTIPSDWFQAQIQYPHQGKNITFKGAFIAGTAVSAPIGRGNYIAWGCTTEYKDTQDLYKQKVQGNRYFVDGQWKNLEQRQQRIRVKNGQDRILTISQTHRGPILTKIPFLQRLYDVPGNVSFAWTGLHTQYDFLSFMIDIMQADQKEEVISKFASLDYGPAMNVVFMTEDDHIGYQSIGRVPRRKAAQSPFFYDGTSSENDWDGYITGRDKLYLDNPEKGFIVTANSRPANSNFHQGYYNTNFQVTSRQHRITKVLNKKIAAGEKLTIQDSIDLQLDNTDEYCLHILPSLRQIDTRFYVLFDKWECNFESDAFQPSIYEAFFLKLQHKLYPQGTLNIYGFLGFNHYTYKFILSTAQSQQPQSVTKVSQSLTEALTMLETKFSSQTKQNWHWGQLHLTYYPHLPFSNSPLKAIFDRYHISSGSLNTPNMGKMTKLHEDNFNCQHHATLRIILSYEPGDSKWLIDTGVSSYPFSNYYDDQELMHRNGEYIEFDERQDRGMKTGGDAGAEL